MGSNVDFLTFVVWNKAVLENAFVPQKIHTGLERHGCEYIFEWTILVLLHTNTQYIHYT